MKLKKMYIPTMLIMTALILCILPAIAKAAPYDCVQCTIIKLGMKPGTHGTTDGFNIRVEDAAGEWGDRPRTFYLDDTLGKAGWATVLTAYSMGKTLYLRLVDTIPGSLITVVLIND
jgi:hypothetical protein